MLLVSDTVSPILGYRITEQLYLGKKTVVYRGIREKDDQRVILKLMRNEYPTFAEVSQFRSQYTITQNLEIPGIVKPLSLENYRNGYVLIMEDYEAISLKDWQIREQEQGNNFVPLKEFFQIALSVCSTLEQLHSHRIIHKDIKPANILVHPTTREIKIIDFSLATLLPKEIQSIKNPNVLEGTLAYISPEQTGRMNRGIDYRTDFYSLGVTFFELLTGQLPFNTNDPMELVYSHIAKEPPKASLINSKIPQILADIISKLMAKNAEDRYQSVYGIRHDLEICQKQWQEKGNITSFALGVRDISNQFAIPEKLYGRQKEIETLLTTFERVSNGKTEMILVSGFSGIGKTAVVNEIHKPIVRQRSYFIKGKFDQMQRDIPLSALVQALRSLIGQILSETDIQIQDWKAKILSALGTQCQVIIDVIPELEKIIGQQPSVVELAGLAAQNRFNLLFQRFIQVFTTKEHPLVIFLDDLQWADNASLKFIQLLMSETAAQIADDTEEISNSKGSLLLIGAYRDNEVSNLHPLTLTLKEIAQTGAIINQIQLSPLNQVDLNHLIADTLHCREVIAVPLTQMVFAKTKGNPFFAAQFLKSLCDDGLITLNIDVGYWQYDIARIKTLSLTDDVVEFMGIQIEKLPMNTQNVLKFAACIGNEFDLKTLAIVNEKSVMDTASDLWKALFEGLILPLTDGYNLISKNDNQILDDLTISSYQLPKYKFVHDRVQQAAYSLIPEEQRKPIHLKIGLLLLSNIPIAEREDKIFELVNQFNIALEFITHQAKRDELAVMNLTAGRKALISTAYSSAIKYLTTGIELLTDDCWDTKYELTLALYETAAEAAYLNGNFKLTEQLIPVILQKAKTLLDKIKAYEVQIQAYGAQGKELEAVNIAIAILKMLGVDFPENPTQEDVQLEIENTSAKLANINIEDLIDLPEITEASALIVMRILSSVVGIAYPVAPKLFLLIILKQINLSITYGNSSFSAFAYVTYGLMLCGVMEDIDSGYKFGKLAENLLHRFQAKEVAGKVLEGFNQLIRHWKEHVRTTLKPLLDVYATNLEVGDVEFAAYALYGYSHNAYFLGYELVGLEKDLATYSHTIQKMKQERVFHWNEIFRQTILNLQSSTENPEILMGEAYDETKMLPIHLEAKDGVALLLLYFCKLNISFLLNNYPEAIKNANMVEKYLYAGVGMLVTAQFYFYDSLAHLAIYFDVEKVEQDKILHKVNFNQEKMQNWANHAPMNHLHKFHLVEAEKYRVIGEYIAAIDNYEYAIAHAKENDYINEEALAYELAAKFYLEWGKQKIAQTYLIDAYYSYIRWGAKAKINDLKKRYPQLLTPIIQQEKMKSSSSENNLLEQRTHLSTTSHQSTIATNETILGSNTSISDMLDLAAVIKASQAVSGEIELKALLSTLIKVVMENAGASKCVLILSDVNNLDLTITAVSSHGNFAAHYTEFLSIPLESSDHVPITLINYVKRIQEILVIDDIKTQAAFALDIYITREEPKSILCIPIINQSKLLGIIYLENNLTTAAFTKERLEVLKLIITQAAISLENALLYQNLEAVNTQLADYNHDLETKVAERTQEINDKNYHLQQALEELRSTQSQLIQSEKMSSLGQMVAGIAHEINNPINFIHGNITHAYEYVQDLLDLVSIYQQECPYASDLIKNKLEEMDLDFLAEDLPKVLDSMKLGSSRIRNIILGLRNFSRLDESEMKPVNIHEGIDSTLMILQHRIKENSIRPEIEIIKEYAQLPEVSCYAGQLNQVFMNILSNAIDALDDYTHKDNSVRQNPQIRIHTELKDTNTLRIRIADNGHGMTAQVQQKIFDPFFTTKPIGSGTGLGLSISYQVVVDKHKGLLMCDSTPGIGTEFVIEIPIRQ
ncbi:MULTISPECIES: trifunctional serine/threonine-protein kinase/ATP-binding protein/sensor histidine kinase [unclassified Tolypothrix]|uniref:trifunctional serine/threonine-protein kinase/ATP-binding protein/sensor histidine kinase n=1 Tax=unclassified Tolypothrix TaxID=2649714 RepID=UPI0005EAB16F|nr:MULTISPECIES: ATP-binding sensor histidine kinase [unclassified Tolypothrix]BAY93172.1 multi-sensor signal transduction multi-kinase [Microchaete diplosiphon NIES-3275]EKF00440.1 ATPase, histidine kinase-, DNA gyrase B-, and HSP90-like domain protein [Tolypothrix sp. PCC 7601]MBE9085803.1 AAA family ATPase [Tolypothrix sp. LEGE 11397]UYD27048.1 AAA family ATPase [Tolypothrix sp. PCC 7712]UYD37094.1 AAA family ATPase [Tolypothrix sp. PCC 7601]